MARLALITFAVLGLTRTAAASTSRADAIARGFGGGGGAGPSEFTLDGRWLAGIVMVATAGVVVGVIAWKVRAWRAKRSQTDAAVLRDIRRALGLSRRQVRVLRTVARELEIRNPAVLLLCPSLLRKARRQLDPRDAAEVQGLLLRLAV